MIDQQKTKMDPKLFFETELEKATTAKAIAQSQFNQLATFRLASFIGSLAGIWLWNSTNTVWALYVAIVLLIIFLGLMRKQQRVRKERDFQKNLCLIYQDELARLKYRFLRADTGIQFQEKKHPFASDLDIFGDYSLYRLLNRTRTSEGAQQLAKWLKTLSPLDDILMRQEASEELQTTPKFIQKWEATALLHEHADQQVAVFRDWANEELDPNVKSAFRWRYFSVITLIVTGIIIAGYLPFWVLLLCLGWHAFILKKIQGSIESLSSRTTKLGQTLLAYSELLEQAEQTHYTTRWWQERRSLISGSSKALLEVGKIFDHLDYRNNPFFSILIGIPTFWDIHCLVKLAKWKSVHKQDIPQWLSVMADIEALNSLAGFGFANPDYTLPQVSWNAQFHIDGTHIGHPLIPADKRISNNFKMDGVGETILITGSNMSGKSTFLRTIGLNLALAQMGAVVCAHQFSCSPVRIFSSMRTQDSLEESTSSFYAELKRLKELLEWADQPDTTPIFYLLDEILKGTNSADRHKGAEALIRQLHQKNASGFVSTHDLELGEWANHVPYAHNFHFRSDVKEGKLDFDYTLHEGICNSFNASELMRMMGIKIDIA
jgi:hypothetical protein